MAATPKPVRKAVKKMPLDKERHVRHLFGKKGSKQEEKKSMAHHRKSLHKEMKMHHKAK